MKKSRYKLSKEQEDRLSAALRHTRDARRLLSKEDKYAASPDQSWHLAGFGLECLRKACLFDRSGDKALGHDLEESDILAVFLALDPHGWRYRVQGGEEEEACVKAWRVEERYARTGTRKETEARRFVDFVEKNADVVTAFLWADGRLLDPEV